MRKATLSKNPALQNKQSFVVQGITNSANIITRDNIEIGIETAERPDGTKIPIGRTNPGEFNISLDLADILARDEFETWAESCIDQPSFGLGRNGGIQPDYKRGAIIVFHRLYATADPQDSQILYELVGCFVTSRTVPDYQMDGTEASVLEMTISYDDARRITRSTMPTWFNNSTGATLGN